MFPLFVGWIYGDETTCGLDPEDFSESMTSPVESPRTSISPDRVISPTSMLIPEIIHTNSGGGHDNGMKGILRPSGTPGSGNGGKSIISTVYYMTLISGE